MNNKKNEVCDKEIIKMATTRAQISIQHDWKDILRSPGQKAWVTCSNEGKPNIYGEIWLKRDGTKEMNATEGFEATLHENNDLIVRHGECASQFISPNNTFRKLHRKPIRALDISPGGSLGVSSSEDGALYIWQADDGKLRRSLEGHISDVTHCQFFPSGMVVLSGGVDMRLKIWSVEDGSCPVTLVAHKAAITDACLIDRGRNFISCSRDGSALLWDCGSSSCLSELHQGNSVINSCALSTHSWTPTSQGEQEKSDRESGTEGKLLIVAKDDGSLDGIDVSSREKVFQCKFEDALNSCCFVNEHRVVAGQQNGSLIVIDIRNTSQPEMILKHGKSSVSCVEPYFKDRVLVGRSDGSCACLCFDKPNSNLITKEFVGSNHDPIYDISLSKDVIYTACRDGVVRKYQVKRQ